MWGFSSKAAAGSTRSNCLNQVQANADCSDDDTSSCASRDEVLECPICWESFNMVENVPYVLWCGHTLCKNCVLGLHWAVVKFPTLPIQLPLFISCPWCHLFSFRLVYKGELKFPHKNYFLLWMVESLNGDRAKSHSSCRGEQHIWSSSNKLISGSSSNSSFARRSSRCSHTENSLNNPDHAMPGPANNQTVERIHSSLRKSLDFFVHLTTKFPLVLIFLLIVVYAIPASAVVLALYILITVLFAVPSFLILYFAYPSLDWLIREIIT